jgi:tetratricopeptide (TPR) repeat protein
VVDPAGISTRAELSAALQGLFERYDGGYLALSTAARLGGPATVHDAVSGKSFPRWSTLERLLRACGVPEHHLPAWQDAHIRVRKAASPQPGPGLLLAKVTNPFELEVRHPIPTLDQEATQLPPYVRRKHDDALDAAVAQALAGYSKLVVLVGEPSTGKTRACWEAVQSLGQVQNGWRLWHPIDPTKPEAMLEDLGRIGPRTVIWLNDAQHYLLTPSSDLGERVAAGLRELLRSPERGPVLVLGTLWPEHWATLIEGPSAQRQDLHAQARALIVGMSVRVPDEFSESDLEALRELSTGDTRLAAALTHSQDRKITQFIAGVPVLMERFFNAPAAAQALIEVAMDARRLGHGLYLTQSFLETALPDYLTSQQWDALSEDWLEQILGYVSASSVGVGGALTRVPPRPTEPASGQVRYRLADFLEQFGRHNRRWIFPPRSFWDSAVRYARTPDDWYLLGRSAEHSGRLRHAADLYQQAFDADHPRATTALMFLRDQTGDHDGADALARMATDSDKVAESLKRSRQAREWAQQDRLKESLPLTITQAVEDEFQRGADAGNPFALQLLSFVREQKGDFATAAALAERAVNALKEHKTDILNTGALLQLARCRASAGNFDNAKHLVMQAVDSGNPFALNELANIQEQRNDPNGAENLRRFGLEADGTAAIPWRWSREVQGK